MTVEWQGFGKLLIFLAGPQLAVES